MKAVLHTCCTSRSLLTTESMATIDTRGDGILSAGDTVEYAVFITNTGTTCLTNVDVKASAL
ncbi:unnamed protein product, partial [Sphacelaria rigidula]